MSEPYYRNDWFDYSTKELIPGIQKRHDGNSCQHAILLFLSKEFNSFFYITLIFCLLLKAQISTQFYYLVIACYSVAIMQLFKTGYGGSRPFWENSSIELYGKCETGHGNPSGHTLLAVLFMWTIFFHTRQKLGNVVV